MNLWEKKKWIAAAIITIFCVGVSFWISQPTPTEEGTLKTVDAALSPKKTKENAGLCVYVSGAVAAPGIYYIPPGERFSYAIQKAGGFTEDADRNRVNLARKCKDGSHVNVPFVKASKRNKTKNTRSSRTAAVSPADTSGEMPARETAVQETAQQGIINVNTADETELTRLPGVGPALARRIVEARQQRTFQSLDDLLEVKGIGPATLSRFRGRAGV
ncbi:MAG: ComEA family DNA-binding protein [Acidaminococcus sp.]|jgi:competence protein ComEA|nr:ComEA family DNA-binding protein [Acidaminococcus sp.]MCI2099537.1 ComEA family DNA-binding protein [Acidaminococcus sp.]MCI2113622.1 ComEA family DNA-binding protein [Acidaminococcus sp.]MCI2115705.1 ComEA family DNA-binding protein [Acidaminococcus sp.]